jgi:hypothetical protein
MPEKQTIKKAKRALRSGKSPSTAAGEFIREEIHHIREGKHGARSTEQAIAIGLSKARRAGVPLATRKGTSRKKATHAPSKTRSRGSTRALEREPTRAASRRALSRHAHQVAKRRTKADRSRSARKAAATRRRRD